MLFVFADDESDSNTERMWVATLVDSLYEVRNTPFFVRGIAFEDIVVGEFQDDVLHFSRLEKESGHSTIRVVMLRPADRDAICQHINSLGCDIEGFNLVLAVDIPPSVGYLMLLDFLDPQRAQGVLEYEEAAISAHHALERDGAASRTSPNV